MVVTVLTRIAFVPIHYVLDITLLGCSTETKSSGRKPRLYRALFSYSESAHGEVLPDVNAKANTYKAPGLT